MKLHDLRPAPGSHTRRTRVGRGIAAGKGKTAGRGTKGQKARAGGSIPPWFEGGQTPLHMRIPKLRGFKNRFKIYYEVVNVGAIAAAAERGAFESGDLPGAPKGKKAAPLTVNQDVLRAVGLVRTMTKPLKILGAGELDVPLFVVADAFTKSAREKIEAAGGTVSVLEMPASATQGPRRGRRGRRGRPARVARTAAGRHAASQKVDARAARDGGLGRARAGRSSGVCREGRQAAEGQEGIRGGRRRPRPTRAEADDAAAEPAEDAVAPTRPPPSPRPTPTPAAPTLRPRPPRTETTADADENA